MDKNGRSYKLYTRSVLGNVTIDFAVAPFTLEFDIKRSNLQSTNLGSIKIYNLAEKTRGLIRKDEYTYDGTDLTRVLVQLDAGYGTTLSTIFKGNASRAQSVREGVDYVTSIEAFDGGDALINANTNTPFAAGTPHNAIVDKLVSDLGPFGVTKGAISNFPDSLKDRGHTVSGNTANELYTFSGKRFFVDNQKAYVLADNDCVKGDVTNINSETGLLGTPVRGYSKISFDILFEPRIRMAQLIKLKSVTDKSFNGDWKVVSIHHRGMISYSNSGNAVTSLELWQPGKLNVIPG